jgi:hypothetical protein
VSFAALEEEARYMDSLEEEAL